MNLRSKTPDVNIKKQTNKHMTESSVTPRKRKRGQKSEKQNSLVGNRKRVGKKRDFESAMMRCYGRMD